MRTSWPLHPSLSRSKDRATTQGTTIGLGYPVLFHWLALVVVSGLLLFAALEHIVPLLVITIFLLVMGLVGRLWSWRSLQAVSYNLTLSHNQVFPGEEIDLTFEVANGKWLFLTWLDIETELPCRLVTGRVKTPSPYARERRRWTTAISGQQHIRWKHSLKCRARGEYRLGPVRLRSGDIFGLFPREKLLARFEPLLVYPKIVPLDKLSLPLRQLVGEKGAPKSIYEDASRTMGARDYQPGDPLKRIHWKASARHGQLQARQYESTSSLNLSLILDVASFVGEHPAANEETFELAVTTVASLAYQALGEKSPVGLMANSVPEINIPTRSGRDQLRLILEALARIEANSRRPLSAQLDEYRSSLPWGATLVIVTNAPSPLLAGLAHKLKGGEHSLLLVSVGEPGTAQNLGGIPQTSVQSLSDISQSYGEAGP
ncbi:MAG: DUF58 domain-containing protein [Chloroflexota bacterium]